MLDRNPDKSMADLRRDLPKTWGSPTMSPHCADEIKYDVVDRVVARFKAMRDAKRARRSAGHPITDLITVNGVRVVADDGTWGLVRASSNKPELVVVVESPVSEERKHEMFKAVDASCAKTRKSATIEPDRPTAGIFSAGVHEVEPAVWPSRWISNRCANRPTGRRARQREMHVAAVRIDREPRPAGKVVAPDSVGRQHGVEIRHFPQDMATKCSNSDPARYGSRRVG
jgi:hypothetical protein